MSRRKQPTPQMLDENKTVSNNAILPDAKSDNFSMGSENSELSEKGKDTRSTQLSNANSTNLTPDSTSETRKKSLSEENNSNVSQSNRQNSSQNQEDFNDMEGIAIDNSSTNDQLQELTAINSIKQRTPTSDVSEPPSENFTVKPNSPEPNVVEQRKQEAQHGSEFDVSSRDLDPCNAQYPAPNGNDSLDVSGELMIAEDEENNQSLSAEDEKDLAKVEEAPPRSNSPLDASEPTGKAMLSSTFKEESREEKEVELRENTRKSYVENDLELLRNQVNLIQQQNTVHMHMIHYLVSQMNYFRNQSFVQGNSPPPNGMQFNPLLQHLMSSYSGSPLLNQSQNVASSIPATFGAMNGFNGNTVNGTGVLNQFMANSVKSETSADKVLDGKLLSQPLSSMFEERKRMESNAQRPIPPSTGANMAESAPLRSELPHSSISTPTTSNGQRSSPPDLQLDKAMKNQCLTCGKFLSCSSALKLHYRTHTGERPYACDMCSRAFTTRGNLRTHYSSVHHRELPPANKSNGRLREKLCCPICNFSCDSNASLTQHMQLHVNQDNNLVVLQQRLQLSAMQNSYASAMAQTAPQSGHDVLASIQNPVLNEHQPQILERQERRLEQLCANSAGAKSFEKENFAQIENEEPVSRALDLTTSTTTTKNFANNDQENVNEFNANFLSRTMATGKDPDVMNRSSNFSTFAPLSNTAVNGVQALDNRHPRFNSCRLCFRRFNDESELYEHLLTHENNKDDAFSQAAENRASSKRPAEQEVTTQKPKRRSTWCKICHKQFSSVSSLSIHMRTHTGEKPYACSICSRAFTTRGNLKVHMNVHEHGPGGTRRGRRGSGSKKSNVDDPLPQASAENSFQSSDALAIIQRYYALAQSLGNGTQGNESESNMGRAWIDPALSAQLFQQQQQYMQNMQNLSAAAESPSATESSTSGDRQNTEPSSPEDPVEAATESNGTDQRNDEEMEPSNEVPNAANNDWLLQMYQKTREVN